MRCIVSDHQELSPATRALLLIQAHIIRMPEAAVHRVAHIPLVGEVRVEVDNLLYRLWCPARQAGSRTLVKPGT